jgi:phospholipase C
MENKAAGDVLGSPSAPEENALAHACASASDYRAYTHPSLPNYLALTSGSAHGVRDDAGPSAHPISGPSLFSELADAGSSWGVYAESMPSPCFGTAAGSFAVKHNPAVYYTELRSTCARYDVPLGSPTAGAFGDGLRAGTLPAFSLVVPNVCNDTHDCPVATGDAWLAGWMRTILDSPTYRAGRTAVFITWDEDDSSSGNRVALIAVAPSIRPGTVATAAFGHPSLLHTTEQMLGIPPQLAPTAPSMRSALHV